MSYNITKSDGTEITVEEGVLLKTYSNTLLGQNVLNYGKYAAENTIRSLENFANDVPPKGAITGQLWFDTEHKALKYYHGPDPINEFDDVSREPTYWTNVSGISEAGIDIDIIPTKDATYTIGTTDKRFHSIYTNHANFSSQGHYTDELPALIVSGNTVIGSGYSISPNITASTTIGSYLGTSDKVWKTLFTRDAVINNKLSFSNTAGLTGSGTRSIVGTGIPGQLISLGTNDVRFDMYSNSIDTTSLALALYGLKSDIIPDIDNAYSMGSYPNHQMKTIASKEFIEDGQTLFEKYGDRGAAILDDLDDVKITSPAIDDTLVYTTTGWINIPRDNMVGANHSTLSNLGSDDHPQYINQTRGDARYLLKTGGVASDSDKLDGLHGTSFMRSDANATNTGSVTINQQLTVGTNATVNKILTANSIVSTTSISAGGNISVTGTITSTGAISSHNDVTAFASDERLKTNIVELKGTLESLDSLRCIRYNFNEVAESHGFDPSKTYIGLVAQEVAELYPEIVRLAPFDDDCGKSISGNNYKTIQYEKMVPVLVEALKEAKDRISALENTVGVLKHIIETSIG